LALSALGAVALLDRLGFLRPGPAAGLPAGTVL